MVGVVAMFVMIGVAAVLDEGEKLKDRLSHLHHLQLEKMQEEDESVKLSLVCLNLLQKSQELVSIMRHVLRASRKFQD